MNNRRQPSSTALAMNTSSRYRPLLLIALAAIAVRWPLWTLPGLGRDEAAYLYWSQHFELAYAPLMQVLLRITAWLPIDLTLQARLPSIIAGALVLFLFDRLLMARQLSAETRAWSLAFVATCPWQSYVGSILHPDNIQLLAVLGFAVAAQKSQLWSAALMAGVAVWTKPSGAIVTIVALPWLLRLDRPLHHKLAAVVMMIGLTLPPLLAFDRNLITGVLSFGGNEVSVGPWMAAAMMLIGLFVLAGPAMLWMAARGLRHIERPRTPVAWLGVAFLFAFSVAAILNGQIKGNWMLPASLLLWPSSLPIGRRPWLTVALVVAIAMSGLISAGFALPNTARGLEERGVGAPSYLSMAGHRESEVASANRWWHRLSEYQSLDDWCVAVEELGPGTPEVVISDDYGLAAQWAMSCPTQTPRLVLPLDPIFADDDARELPVGSLVVAVREPIERLVGDTPWATLGTVEHPITGDPIQLAIIMANPFGEAPTQ
jgi:hypothetical protein